LPASNLQALPASATLRSVLGGSRWPESRISPAGAPRSWDARQLVQKID